eukprot:TRINITY_DN34562_c0_g1_i1.p1 TRINITY_DN34562_c0_g1~~TRINITY_DN34562_c0_g1_i1.p1  ORF type:complete len:359 (-),score=73.27 TRINITY_DN34562_c0_g1_i1:118-1194(-)
MKYLIVVVFGLCALGSVLAGSSPSPFAGPQGSHSSPSPDPVQEREKTKREVKVQVEADKAEIESKSIVAGTTSRLKFELDAASDTGIKLRLRFRKDAAEAQTEFRFRIRLIEMFEFDPSTATGGKYAGGPVVKRVALSNKDRTSITQLPSTTSNGVVLHHFQYSSSALSLKFSMSDSQVKNPGSVSFNPESLKFDVIIPQYSYASPNNRLALEIKLDSDSKAQVRNSDTSTEGETSESEVNIGGAGYLSYVRNAKDGNGADVPILVSPIVDDDDSSDSDRSTREAGEITKRFYFTFGKNGVSPIVWDPKVGTSTAAVGADGSTFNPTNAAATTTFPWSQLVSTLVAGIVLAWWSSTSM